MTKNPLDGKCYPATRIAFRAAKLGAIGKFNIVCHIPETNQSINLDHGRGEGLPPVAAEGLVAAAEECAPGKRSAKNSC